MPMEVNWGDVPTWVSSIVGIVALIAAVVAALYARGIYKVESGRDQVAEEERRARAEGDRRGQSDRVAAWWHRHTTGKGQFVRTSWAASIRNASDLPIYDVHVRFFDVDEQPNMPRQAIERGSTDEPIRVVPPNDTVLVGVPPSLRSQVDFVADDQYVVAIEFRDAAGNRWARNVHGNLTELPQLPSTQASAVQPGSGRS